MNQAQSRTVNHQKLRSDLQKLHGELRTIKSLDDEEQRLLRVLDSDIAALLARDDLKPDGYSHEQLSQALVQIEASHPRVTLLMRQMVDSLAYLGI